MTHFWKNHEAMDQISELVNAAESDGPQIITRQGAPVAVVLSYEEYSLLVKPRTDLVEFFHSSPLAGIELDVERDNSLDRKVDFP